MKPVHISRIRRAAWLAVFCLLCGLSSRGQNPCHDTLVHVYDSICDGETYDFNGRILTYSGLFFDTLPRVLSECDSIIIMHLTILDVSPVDLYPYRRCEGNVGYDLYSSGMGRYFVWSSVPIDTMLESQQNQSWVHINPQQPTVYTLQVDYRSDMEQCPSSGSLNVNPIVLVTGSMHVWPDELTLDHLEFKVEDFSTGTREYHWGGWGGRHWYINGVHQDVNKESVTFTAEPWWPDTVEVMMEAFTPTCLDTVIKLIPFKKISLLFPNVFTPDLESNRLFAPRLLGVTDFEMWIFSQRGTLMFHSLSADEAWDGTYEGRPCPMGTYVYRCRYRDIYTPEGDQTMFGTVTLVR